MKRTLAMLLCFVLGLSVCACTQADGPAPSTSLPSVTTQPPVTTLPPQSEPVQTEPPETTLPVPTEPPVTEPLLTDPVQTPYNIPLTTLSLPMIQETAGNVTFQYPNVTFQYSDAAVARTVLLDLRNRIEACRSDKSTVISCTPMRVDQSVVSLLLTQQTGMEVSCQTVTYDLVNGKPISLSDLLSQDTNADSLQDMLSQALSSMDNIYGWSDEILSELFSGNSLPENWYLSAEGLCFYFMPYEIAPYSITAVIAYHQLGGTIRDRYYLPEFPEAIGAVLAADFTQAELSVFQSFAEVMVDDSDSSYLIYPTDVISQLRISTVVYDDYSETPRAEHVVFATDLMTPGQAVRVQYQFVGLMSTLEIRYISGGETYICYLRISGEDGSIFLSE